MNRSQLFESIIGDQTQIASTIGRAVALAIIILLSCWCIIIGSQQSFLWWLSKKELRSNAVVLFINKRTAALIPILISVVLFVHYINSDKAHQEHYSANTQLFAQVVAVHIPVWLSVLALKVLLDHQLDQYFPSFYQLSIKRRKGRLSRLESSIGLKFTMSGLLSAVIAIGIGVYHQVNGNWITNNILCLAATIILIEIIQMKSFMSGAIFLLGMIWFDLFWMYGINLLTTVVKETRAPVLLYVPKNFNGDFQKLATPDIIVPGLFLALVFRHSCAERANKLTFRYGLLGFALGLVITFIIAIITDRTTPAMVAPSILCVLFSLASASKKKNFVTFSQESIADQESLSD